MKLRLHDERALHDPAAFPYLRRLVATVERGWHEWHAPSPSVVSKAPFADAHPYAEPLITKSFVKSRAYSQARTAIDIVPSTAAGLRPTWLRLASAATFAEERLRVLVENAHNDGTFYLRALRAAAPDVADLFTSADPPIEFENAGGKDQIPKILERRWNVARKQGSNLRVLVIRDSDKSYPGEPDDDGLQTVRGVCAAYRLPIHVLDKRAIENYLPDDVIVAYTSSLGPREQSAAAFILGLSARQRDHFPFRTGLTQKSPEAGVVALYGGLVGVDHRLPKVARFFVNDWKHPLTSKDLADRDALNEFVRLATLVRETL